MHTIVEMFRPQNILGETPDPAKWSKVRNLLPLLLIKLPAGQIEFILFYLLFIFSIIATSVLESSHHYRHHLCPVFVVVLLYFERRRNFCFELKSFSTWNCNRFLGWNARPPCLVFLFPPALCSNAQFGDQFRKIGDGDGMSIGENKFKDVDLNDKKPQFFLNECVSTLLHKTLNFCVAFSGFFANSFNYIYVKRFWFRWPLSSDRSIEVFSIILWASKCIIILIFVKYVVQGKRVAKPSVSTICIRRQTVIWIVHMY